MKEKVLHWLTATEVLGCGWLAAFSVELKVIEHHGSRKAWQSRAPHLTGARREGMELRVRQSPSGSSNQAPTVFPLMPSNYKS